MAELDRRSRLVQLTPRNVVLPSDVRALAGLRSPAGVLFRDFKQVAEHSAVVDLGDWPLVGPRTAKYFVTVLSRTGLTPVGRHTHWKHENDLRDDDQMCVSHEVLSEVLELLGCHDQLDLANLCGVESLVRQLQFLENEVRKRTEASRPPSGAEYYLGRPKKVGGAIQDPSLTEFISQQAQKESNILKEQRKAREERQLVRPNAEAGPGPKTKPNAPPP